MTSGKHHSEDDMKRYFPYLLLIPTFFFLFLFTYLPLFASLKDSLFDSRIRLDQAEFSGVNNYLRLFHDAVFWQSLQNTVIYLLLTVVPGVFLALGLAVLVTNNSRLNQWLRGAFFFPTIIPLVSAATIWTFIFIPNLGLLDYYLAQWFGPMNHNYLGLSDTALVALCMVGIWKFAGYYMLFFLAGLQAIPAAPREAAVMEGATSWQIFRMVTFPLLRPTFNFVVITAVVYSVTQIDHVPVMTQGGPNNASSVLLYYIQDLATNSHDFGKASAATFISLIILFGFSLFNLRILERGVHYEHA